MLIFPPSMGSSPELAAEGVDNSASEAGRAEIGALAGNSGGEGGDGSVGGDILVDHVVVLADRLAGVGTSGLLDGGRGGCEAKDAVAAVSHGQGTAVGKRGGRVEEGGVSKLGKRPQA